MIMQFLSGYGLPILVVLQVVQIVACEDKLAPIRMSSLVLLGDCPHGGLSPEGSAVPGIQV